MGGNGGVLIGALPFFKVPLEIVYHILFLVVRYVQWVMIKKILIMVCVP